MVPGKYGPEKHKRAGHVHAIIRPPKERKDLDGLVTQIYVCKANDEKELGTDLYVLLSLECVGVLEINSTFDSDRTIQYQYFPLCSYY